MACMKKEIILFMWAGFPQNRFMVLRNYPLPEKAVRCEMITRENKITHIAVQFPSKFVLIDVETSKEHTVFEALIGKSVPLNISPMGADVLLVYHSTFSPLPPLFFYPHLHLRLRIRFWLLPQGRNPGDGGGEDHMADLPVRGPPAHSQQDHLHWPEAS